MCVLWFDLLRDMSYTFVCFCLLLLDDGSHVAFKGIIAAVFLLLLLAISGLAVWIFCRRRSHKETARETRTTVEEVDYTDAIFTANRAQDSETNEQSIQGWFSDDDHSDCCIIIQLILLQARACWGSCQYNKASSLKVELQIQCLWHYLLQMSVFHHTSASLK